MSNCLAQDTFNPTQQLLWFAGCAIAAAIFAFLLRVHRPTNVLGPLRITSDGIVWRLAVCMGIGATFWLGAQATYGAFKAITFAQANPGQIFKIELLGAGDYAFLATVPYVIGILALWMPDLALDRGGRTLIRAIGITDAGTGVAKGVLAFLAIGPLMFAAALALEWLYRVLHYEHPQEHDLLAKMREAGNPAIKVLLIIGATTLAPLFEEFLFRGHLQTVLAGILNRKSKIENRKSNVSRMWAAILITSLLFAIVHPLWTTPLIFLLSLCLGYAYERTGNLWTSITIHALFNTTNTLIYLMWAGR